MARSNEDEGSAGGIERYRLQSKYDKRLTFADDIVLTAGSVETMQQLLDICAGESAVLGLQYNSTMSAVVPFAGSEEIRIESLKSGVDDIPVFNMYRYLGVTLLNEVDYLKEHHTHLRLAAMRGASMLGKGSLWSCNRFIKSQELWKAAMVPGLTFANAVMQMTSRSLIRVLIWLISLGGFFYQTGTMLKMFFEYPFSVSVVEKLHEGIMFPAVTICLENWIDRSAYCSLDGVKCGPDGQVNQSKLLEMEYDYEAQKKIAVSPADIFECSLSSTDPTIRRTYFRHPKHMCYTLDPEQYQSPISRNGFLKCRSPWTWELSLIVHWITKHTIAINDTGKFPVIVHRPQTCPPDKLSAVVGDTGSSYVLSVTQQTVDRLPPPYESKCTDYLKEGNQPAFGGFMTHDIVEAFGYLGGYLGMWLGFSLLSILKSLQKKLFDFFFVSSTTKLTSVSRYGLSLSRG
ncbi:hypothetical protein HPB47_023535, partial [Ixodes persulcatus]